MCFGLCHVVVSLVKPKKQNTQHKRKLREEIKSSFFSRNSQLISNSTMYKTHSTWHCEHTYRKRAYWHSDAYIAKTKSHIYTCIVYIYIYMCARVQSNTPRHMMLKTSLKIRNVSAPKIERSIHIKENGLHN